MHQKHYPHLTVHDRNRIEKTFSKNLAVYVGTSSSLLFLKLYTMSFLKFSFAEKIENNQKNLDKFPEDSA